MIKGIKKLTLAALACTLTSSVFAAMPVPLGWYLEVNGGGSSAQDKNYGNGTTIDRSGWGWNGNIGYKFMPYFATELGYTSYAPSKIKNSSLDTQAAKDTHYSVDLAAKGILPLTNSGAELFAKLGAARLNSHTSVTNQSAMTGLNFTVGTRNSIGYYLGLGAEYAFMPNFIGVAQWARAKGNSNTGALDLYSIGLAYIFD